MGEHKTLPYTLYKANYTIMKAKNEQSMSKYTTKRVMRLKRRPSYNENNVFWQLFTVRTAYPKFRVWRKIKCREALSIGISSLKVYVEYRVCVWCKYGAKMGVYVAEEVMPFWDC